MATLTGIRVTSPMGLLDRCLIDRYDVRFDLIMLLTDLGINTDRFILHIGGGCTMCGCHKYGCINC